MIITLLSNPKNIWKTTSKAKRERKNIYTYISNSFYLLKREYMILYVELLRRQRMMMNDGWVTHGAVENLGRDAEGGGRSITPQDEYLGKEAYRRQQIRRTYDTPPPFFNLQPPPCIHCTIFCSSSSHIFPVPSHSLSEEPPLARAHPLIKNLCFSPMLLAQS